MAGECRARIEAGGERRLALAGHVDGQLLPEPFGEVVERRGIRSPCAHVVDAGGDIRSLFA